MGIIEHAERLQAEKAARLQAGFYCDSILVYERLATVWQWECRCGESGMATKRSEALRGALAHAEAEEAR